MKKIFIIYKNERGGDLHNDIFESIKFELTSQQELRISQGSDLF
jgi:hypothetical protein